MGNRPVFQEQVQGLLLGKVQLAELVFAGRRRRNSMSTKDRIQLSDHFTYRKLFVFVLPTIAKSNLEKDPSIVDKIVCADMPVVKKPPENRRLG